MSNYQHIKEGLYEACLVKIEERIESLESNLASIIASRNDESKSSVGDKYETGRAMMQLEEERNRGFLAEAQKVKKELVNLDLAKRFEQIAPGSLVVCSNGTYFLSIGMGKVDFEGKTYFCVSGTSPIGQQLLNKKVGGSVSFNGRQISIKAVG